MSSENKHVAEATTLLKNASALLLDIEGTTTSISFVKDTLFPYVRANLATYLQENWAEASFQDVLKKLVEQSKADVEAKMEGAIALDDEEESAEKAQEAVKSSVLWMMDSDRKVGALKTLQGQMYVKGYEKELKGHLFDDVVPELKKWTEAGKKLYIFSSGSVEAQKLLFGHSTEGDVTAMISAYFDTEVGSKVEKESYTKIVEKIGKPVAEVLFFTDVVKEAEAAKEAGLAVIVMEREGNVPLTEEDKKKFTVLTSFKVEEPEEEVPAKKQKLDEDATTTAEEKPADVEMKSTEKESEEKTEKKESNGTNGTNGVHHENGTNGTNGSNGTNGTEEKETKETEKESNEDAKTEAVSEKVVSPVKKVVTEDGAGDAPKEVVAE